jgi:hypothetical protein
MRSDNWNERDIVEFDIHCKMKRCWANELLSFLAMIEGFGNIGHSGLVGFYADGDGDCRPKFTNNLENFQFREPMKKTNIESIDVFDAG